MNGPQSARVSKASLVLLALMTVVTFTGPFGLGWVLSGGRDANWPPDRPVEWVTAVAVFGSAIALMTAILAIGLTNLRAMNAETKRLREKGGP